MDKTRVVVSRLWQRPSITAFVTSSEVGASMAVHDFVQAVAMEVGSPTTLMTRAQLLKKMQDASAVVLSEMKGSTKAV